MFLICLLGATATTPVHFLSVEHRKLEERFGKEKGKRIGEICGLVSGWGLFLFWMGIWISPQPRFITPLLENIIFTVPVIIMPIPLLHLVASLVLLAPSVWLAVKGVKGTTLRVAETHKPDRIVTAGVYSIVRHPQYLGGLAAHVGISFLLSAELSLLSTPLIIVIIYLIARKEEEELTKEFGEEYENYKKMVPMLVPRLKRR